MTGLGRQDAYLELTKVDGGKKGAGLLIQISCRCCLCKNKTTGEWRGLVLLSALSTGDATAFNGQASFTVPLNAEKANTIRLVGGHGDINIDYVTVSPLE